jgi:hypothetical protein
MLFRLGSASKGRTLKPVVSGDMLLLACKELKAVNSSHKSVLDLSLSWDHSISTAIFWKRELRKSTIKFLEHSDILERLLQSTENQAAYQEYSEVQIRCLNERQEIRIKLQPG